MVYLTCKKFGIRWAEYMDPIGFMDRSSYMEIGLCWYQKGTDKWTYDLTDILI